MAKEMNASIWKPVSVANIDGVEVKIHGCGLGVGSLLLISTKSGEVVTSSVTYVPDLRLKEIQEKNDKGNIVAHFWGFNTGNM